MVTALEQLFDLVLAHVVEIVRHAEVGLGFVDVDGLHLRVLCFHGLGSVSPVLFGNLMEQHGLWQEDLSDCTPQGQISDILQGRREVSKAVAKRLAQRFRVRADVFL